MKLARIMLPLVCSAPVLLGCSTPAVAPVATAKPIKVQPVLRVRDAAGSARDFYQLGRYYQGQNRFAQAADAYRKALEYHKDDIEARNALATTYSAQGKLDEAIAEFEAILKVKPELAHLHNNLGYAYYLQGNFGNAVAAFETARALEPGNPRTYNNLGLAYRKMGDSEKSRLAFARAAALNNTGAGAVAASGAAGNIASAAPSIALKNDAPRIDLPPQSASLPLTTGNDGVALAAATAAGCTSPLPPRKCGRFQTRSRAVRRQLRWQAATLSRRRQQPSVPAVRSIDPDNSVQAADSQRQRCRRPGKKDRHEAGPARLADCAFDESEAVPAADIIHSVSRRFS